MCHAVEHCTNIKGGSKMLSSDLEQKHGEWEGTDRNTSVS